MQSRALYIMVTLFTLQVFNRLHKLHLCSSHRDTLKCLDILGSGYDDKVKLWRDKLTPRIIQSDSVCINNTQFKNVCTMIVIWLQVSKSSMQQLSKEAVSTLFSVQEDEAESDSDFSMDSSLDSDPQDRGIYTSTPIKLNRTTNLGSDASSPASFSGPSFSLLEDSIDDSELPSLHEKHQ